MSLDAAAVISRALVIEAAVAAVVLTAEACFVAREMIARHATSRGIATNSLIIASVSRERTWTRS
jgi:hypothetical protein